jgi:hypothetical protein
VAVGSGVKVGGIGVSVGGISVGVGGGSNEEQEVTRKESRTRTVNSEWILDRRMA